jgi:putative oxidoreductase
MKFLGRFETHIYAIMRILVGFMFSCHGAQKLFGVLGGHGRVHEPLMLVAAVIEFAGGILIILGLFTRIAAFIASGEMAFGYFMVHAPRSFFPLVNQGELAVVYCFIFLYIASRGAVKWGIDRS